MEDDVRLTPRREDGRAAAPADRGAAAQLQSTEAQDLKAALPFLAVLLLALLSPLVYDLLRRLLT